MRTRQRLVLLLIGLVALLGVCSGGLWWLLQPADTAGTRPTAQFRAPEPNAQVTVGQAVAIQGWAHTRAPQAQIARLLLWVDGRLVGEVPGPANPLVNAWQWTPTRPGDHTLVLMALDTAGRKGSAYRALSVQPAADDPDGDGLAGAQDHCPDQAGPWSYGGCPQPAPDADGDGIPDARDACPDQAAPAGTDGCPLPGANDSDGDGLPNDADACPNTPGPQDHHGCPLPADADGDGVPDWSDPCPFDFGPGGGCPPAPDADGDGTPDDLDACPAQSGPPETLGCPQPDDDNDGIPNDADACPDQAGPVNNNGCPAPSDQDADGDGVPDDADACPHNPGPVDNSGCPLTDTDGDGTPDDADACPDQAGPADNGGCPRPDADGDGLPDDVDACPDLPGPEGNGGCPLDDNDGDGIPNDVDTCPDLDGQGSPDGCPAWVHGFGDDIPGFEGPRMCDWMPALCNLGRDNDGDGIPDIQDACPDIPGLPINEGCPLMPLGPEMPEFLCPSILPQGVCDLLGSPPEEEADQPETWAEPPDEVSLYLGYEDKPSLETDAAWERVYCVVNLNDMGWVNLPADLWTPAGSPTQWMLDEARRSVTLSDPPAVGIGLRLVCWGWRDISEGEVALGQIQVANTWDGRPRWEWDVRSSGGEDGHFFRAHVLVCNDPSVCP